MNFLKWYTVVLVTFCILYSLYMAMVYGDAASFYAFLFWLPAVIYVWYPIVKKPILKELNYIDKIKEDKAILDEIQTMIIDKTRKNYNPSLVSNHKNPAGK